MCPNGRAISAEEASVEPESFTIEKRHRHFAKQLLTVAIELLFDDVSRVSSLGPRPRPSNVLAKPAHGLVDLVEGEILDARDP